jgi:hypothetical protein
MEYAHYMEVSNKMKQNLNEISGRIAAARWGEWQKLLADRWRYYFLDDQMENDAPCLNCSNMP